LSLLEKINPKATWQSVLRRSVACGVVGALLGFAVLAGDARPRSDTWVIGFAAWIMLCLFVGAVFEWQVPDELPEPTDREHTVSKESR
jgi:hypothetical protein